MSHPECEILHKNVYYFPGAISNIDAVMEALETVNSLSVTPWETWYANNNSKENPYGDLKTLSHPDLEAETDLAVKTKSEYVLTSILGAMESCTAIYLKNHGADEQELLHLHNEIYGSHTYGIRRYDENKDMGPHTDMVVADRDTITIAVYLDDEYEGGELGIVQPGLNIAIKNKAGSIVVFPSGYLHESRPLLSGRKTIITHVHMPIKKLLDLTI